MCVFQLQNIQSFLHTLCFDYTLLYLVTRTTGMTDIKDLNNIFQTVPFLNPRLHKGIH